MGYRSEIGYVIQGPKEKLLPVLMTYRMTHSDPAEAKKALNDCTFAVEDETLTIRFFGDGWKWYDSYPEVIAHVALFDAFTPLTDLDDCDVSSAFIRIGEDDSDVESEYHGNDPYELIGLNRSIYFDVEDGEPLEKVLGVL